MNVLKVGSFCVRMIISSIFNCPFDVIFTSADPSVMDEQRLRLKVESVNDPVEI